MIQISTMSSPTWFVHMFWNYKHAMPHYCNNNNNNNNSSAILIFWSPKLLRSGSLEHKTGMDIEKIVDSSRREHAINMIATSLIFILNFRLLVQQLYHIPDFFK